MKNLLILIAIIIICGISFTAKADKTYSFSYDANGNRTAVAFQSTCGERRKDTTQRLDTIAETALKEIKAVTTPAAYPNPVHDFLIISLPELQKVATLQIFDMNGNVVFKDDAVTTLQSVIKTCGLAAGTYTIVLNYGADKPFVQKMVKQ